MSRAPQEYIILGDPTPIFTKYKANPHVYGRSESANLTYDRQLEDLLHGCEPFKGPLQLDVDFYLQMPRVSLKKKQELEGKYNPTMSNMEALSHLIKILHKRGLYGNEAAIVALCINKRYSATPRTVFTITELT